MKKYLLSLVLLLSGFGSAAVAQTHTFPALDTNNTFTGINIFNNTVKFPTLGVGCLQVDDTGIVSTTTCGGGGGTVPTGTGFYHITGGSADGSARAIDLSTADVTGQLPLGSLVSSSVTINGTVCNLGSTCTITAGGGGTVTAVSVTTANGFQGTSSGGATPALTLNVDSTHVLPVNTGSSTTYLNGTGAYTTPPGLTPPTGTGFPHITSGIQDGSARAVGLATAGDVSGILPTMNGGTGSNGFNGLRLANGSSADTAAAAADIVAAIGSTPVALATAVPVTGVTAASYTNANFTVNAQGRLTAVTNGVPGALQNSGVPAVSCFAGQKYTQTDAVVTPIDLSQWTCSKNAVVWTNNGNGAVVTATSGAPVTSGYLGAYELTESSGSFVDSSGNGNTLPNTGAVPVTYNAGLGVNIERGRYIPFPATWFANGNTFMACGSFFENYSHVGPSGGVVPGRTQIISPGPADGYGFGLDEGGRPSIIPPSFTGTQAGLTTDSIYVAKYPSCLSFSATNSTTSMFTSGTTLNPGNLEGPRGRTLAAQSQAGVGDWPNGGTSGATGVANNSKLYKFYVWNRILDLDERQAQAIFARTTLAAVGITLQEGYTVPTGPVILPVGDSQTSGATDTSVPPGYPPILAGLVPGGMQVVNFGVASALSTSVANEVAALGVAIKQAGNPSNVFIPIWGGTNDINAALSPSTIFSAYSAIAVTAKQYSAKTLYLTVLPALRCASTCETNRVTYNNLWLAGAPTDGLVHIGADLRFQNGGATWALSSDGLHPNHTGYNIIARRVLTEINRLAFTGTQGIFLNSFSATPTFFLAKGLFQTMPVTANVTNTLFDDYNQGTQARVDFTDVAGGHTISLGSTGTGATGHATLTGSTPSLVIDTAGSGYVTTYPPIVTVTGGTCTTYPKWLATVSGGTITGFTTVITGSCSVVPTTVTFVSTEPASNKLNLLTTANSVTTVYATWDQQAQTVQLLAPNSLGAPIASAATISPTASVTHVTGTATISTINLPYAGFVGIRLLITDAASSFTTTGNIISTGFTATAGKTYTVTYDGSGNVTVQ